MAILFVALTCVSALVGAEPVNLAEGRPYTWSREPRYPDSMDAGDAVQLTDGVRLSGTTGDRPMWDCREAVGWKSCRDPFSITVDLGKIEPIAGFSLDFAAGQAGVRYPNALLLYTSDDGKRWRLVGDLYAQSRRENGPPKFNGYETYVAKSLKMPSSGRYVQFVVDTTLIMTISELEVFRGVPCEAGPALIDDPRAHAIGCRLCQRLIRDLRMVGADDDAALLARINALADDNSLTLGKTLLPLNGVHRDIWARNARRLQKAGFVRPALWTNDRWENLDPLAIPPSSVPEDLVVRMMRNETRSTAVNVVNPTDRALACTVAVEGLPEAAAVDCREVLFTDTKEYECIAAALKPGDGKSVAFDIPAGVSKQVWISFVRPKGFAGAYAGRVVARLGDETLSLGLKLQVEDLDFPDLPRLQLSGCDYQDGACDYFGFPKAAAANRAMMRELYTYGYWATRKTMPRGARFDADGRLSNPDELDFSQWDEWTARFPDARFLALFVYVDSPQNQLAAKGGAFGYEGEPIGTPRFDRMVGEYFKVWYAHIEKQGLASKRIILGLVDEPAEWKNRYQELPGVFVAWAKAIKRMAPGFHIYLDPCYNIDPHVSGTEMYEACDIIVPQVAKVAVPGKVPQICRDYYRSFGKELWLYSCSGSTRLLDPVVYYRQAMWLTRQWGATGFDYWAFGSGAEKADSWHAYRQVGAEYSPYFQGETDVMAAKQSEGLKEGVQDYEYLAMLDDAIDAGKAAGRDVSGYERLRDAAIAEALNQTGKDGRVKLVQGDSPLWNEPKDRGSVERARLRVLEALVEIRKGR